MCRLKRRRTPGIAPQDGADFWVGYYFLNRGTKSQRRTGKPRNFVLRAKIGDGDRINQRSRERLVNKDRLACLEDRPNLIQMRTAIDAFQQDDIHFLQQVRDRSDNLDAHFAVSYTHLTL